jgi:hypothetical protein
VLPAAADRGRPPARVNAGRAAVARSTLLPDFTLFGWVSPPVESTTTARIAEYAGCGLNVAVPAWGDSGKLEDNRFRMNAAAGVGVRCIAWDRRLENVKFDPDSALDLIDSVAADYHAQPGFLAYYFEDEPRPERFAFLGRFFAEFRAKDPDHPSFDNLLGPAVFPSLADWQSYVRAYADAVQPAVLCDDQYDFFVGHDGGRFVENCAALSALAREYGVPWWSVVQLIAHGPFREPTIGELRWQVAMMLAYGARGVGYFTYWTPAPDPQWNWQQGVIRYDGTRSHWYNELAQFNPRVQAVGQTLASLTWLATEHAGSVPRGATAFAPDSVLSAVNGRAALGEFTDGAGTPHLLLVNPDSSATQTITLVLARPARVQWLAGAGNWQDVVPPAMTRSVPVTLEAGDFTLLRLVDDPVDELVAGTAPEMKLSPNPARGAVTFAVTRVAEQATLQILDASGRRVWQRTASGPSATLQWHGETDRGAPARSGLYFARVEDARGVAVQRFAWLGR